MNIAIYYMFVSNGMIVFVVRSNSTVYLLFFVNCQMCEKLIHPWDILLEGQDLCTVVTLKTRRNHYILYLIPWKVLADRAKVNMLKLIKSSSAPNRNFRK